MAVTLTTLQPSEAGFLYNAYSADWSGCEEIAAAVSGQSHYLYSVAISSTAAITVTIGAGETAGAVTATIIGPIHMAANSSFVWVFREPVKVAASTAIVADASGAGACTIIIEGQTK